MGRGQEMVFPCVLSSNVALCVFPACAHITDHPSPNTHQLLLFKCSSFCTSRVLISKGGTRSLFFSVLSLISWKPLGPVEVPLKSHKHECCWDPHPFCFLPSGVLSCCRASLVELWSVLCVPQRNRCPPSQSHSGGQQSPFRLLGFCTALCVGSGG